MLDFLPILLSAITVVSGVALFLQKKLMRSVVFLALASFGSALIFLYLNQPLVALLQLLVFVGGLSTYLMVAVATEEKRVKMRNAIVFVIAGALMTAALFTALSGLQTAQLANNDFSTAAQSALSSYYAFFFIAIFLLFATAIGSVVVIKRFAKLVV